ncbi:MAG: hypothetical protein ACFB2W_04810 [Leptolyngbyaceae cyanobacterium]
MNIQNCITHPRTHHIVDSYQLKGDDGEAFLDFLTQLLAAYPPSLVELALTETIVRGWSDIPMQRGIPFIETVHKRLQSWQSDSIDPSFISFETINSKHFEDSSLASKTNHSRVFDPDSVDTLITPSQFEQITGLDASLVFDERGKVRLTTAKKKPLEPQP